MSTFKPYTFVGDIAVTPSSVNRACPIYSTALRFAPEEDIYVSFGDSSVNAAIGSGIKILGGTVETIEIQYPAWTNYAVIAPVACNMNITGGSEL